MNEEDIREIRRDVAKIKEAVSKMNNHIDFIDSVYNRMSPMLNFLTFRFQNASTRSDLKYNECRLINDTDTQENTDNIQPECNNIKSALIPILGISAVVAATALALSRKN